MHKLTLYGTVEEPHDASVWLLIPAPPHPHSTTQQNWFALACIVLENKSVDSFHSKYSWHHLFPLLTQLLSLSSSVRQPWPVARVWSALHSLKHDRKDREAVTPRACKFVKVKYKRAYYPPYFSVTQSSFFSAWKISFKVTVSLCQKAHKKMIILQIAFHVLRCFCGTERHCRILERWILNNCFRSKNPDE